MSQFVETACKTMTAGAAIEMYSRVKFDGTNVVVCGADDDGIGTLDRETFASGDAVAVRLWSAQGTRKMVAAAAISANALVYGAASGQITSTPSSVPVGRALEAATAASDVIEVATFNSGGGGGIYSTTIAYTENATNTIHTGTVEIPAGATLLDIQVVNTVLWTGGTASFAVGDDDDADGWFTSVDCKATDLVVGEVLSITNSENWGGVNGAYLVAATGRKGRVTAGVDSGVYYGAASEVIGVMTVGTPATTAGRTFMTVVYSLGVVVAATATGP